MENRVKFKIGEIEFEAEGSADVIERERSVFLNSLLPAAIDAIVQTKNTVENKQSANNKNNRMTLLEAPLEEAILCEKDESKFRDLNRTSLCSFLNSYGTLGDQDFALISAYYDEKKNDKKSFSLVDIKQYYAEARRTEYSNISELLRQLAQKGLIMDDPDAESKSPKQYIITTDGLNYVNNYQPKETKTTKKSSVKRKNKSKLESSYSNLCIDDLHLESYNQEIKNLKDFKDQMLLILYIIYNERKGHLFSAQDIEYIISNIFGLPVTYNQIQGVFRRNKTFFKKENDSDNSNVIKYRLLEGAKDYAKSLLN